MGGRRAPVRSSARLSNSGAAAGGGGGGGRQQAGERAAAAAAAAAARRARAAERAREVEDSPAELRDKCRRLARALQNAKHLVVYTGAGISTAADIPDYRGPHGVWTRLQRGEAVGRVEVSRARPTYTHMALTALWARGTLKFVVSQNCDGLHVRAGLPRRALAELHGDMFAERCAAAACRRVYLRAFDTTERTARHAHGTRRLCHACGAELQDTIVHFGERGRAAWPLNWAGALRHAAAADVVLCLGSSLKVLRRYPRLWRMQCAPHARPDLYIVNLQWTPKDAVAKMKINARCDDVMAAVARRLRLRVPRYSPRRDPLLAHAEPLLPHEAHTTRRRPLSPHDPASDLEPGSASELESSGSGSDSDDEVPLRRLAERLRAPAAPPPPDPPPPRLPPDPPPSLPLPTSTVPHESPQMPVRFVETPTLTSPVKSSVREFPEPAPPCVWPAPARPPDPPPPLPLPTPTALHESPQMPVRSVETPPPTSPGSKSSIQKFPEPAAAAARPPELPDLLHAFQVTMKSGDATILLRAEHVPSVPVAPAGPPPPPPPRLSPVGGRAPSLLRRFRMARPLTNGHAPPPPPANGAWPLRHYPCPPSHASELPAGVDLDPPKKPKMDERQPDEPRPPAGDETDSKMDVDYEPKIKINVDSTKLNGFHLKSKPKLELQHAKPETEGGSRAGSPAGAGGEREAGSVAALAAAIMARAVLVCRAQLYPGLHSIIAVPPRPEPGACAWCARHYARRRCLWYGPPALTPPARRAARRVRRRRYLCACCGPGAAPARAAPPHDDSGWYGKGYRKGRRRPRP